MSPHPRGRPPLVALALSLLVLAGCASRPPAPDWQADSHAAIERYQKAFLSGATRAANAEFRIAREALASTGNAAQVARAELTRCALQVAALDFSACDGFERLRADATAAERAYADYLAAAALSAQAAALLPAWHRAAASGAASADAVRGIEDPLGRLVAAGVQLRRGQASPEVLQLATDTASRQGWRRPLLAWLGAQAMRAEAAGDSVAAEALRRRMALVSGGSN
jgi:hypothetical protein